MRVLGIDPGSRVTGYGVVDCENNRIKHVASGTIKLPTGGLPARLKQIYEGIGKIIVDFEPNIAVVEDVFVSVNPRSALLLGHARGSAICAAAAHDLVVYEYSTKEIKLSVTGRGAASKQQVQFMVRMLLCLTEEPNADQADALACALTHCQRLPQSLAQYSVQYRGEGPAPAAAVP